MNSFIICELGKVAEGSDGKIWAGLLEGGKLIYISPVWETRLFSFRKWIPLKIINFQINKNKLKIANVKRQEPSNC